MKIKILDCTLRDGGYINSWEFSNQAIVSIVKALDESSIDVIECGYINDKKGKKNDSTIFDSIESIDNIIDSNLIAKKVVMINLGDYNIDNLPRRNETNIDGIRLAFHKKDKNIALLEAKKIISLGYKLYFQPMVTKNYQDIEFLSLIKNANELGVYAFYIVDSFGSMTLKEFQRYMILADNNLDNRISLGYHSHNNMQLAFSNAVNMCNTKFSRDIIIDSSIYGIGRGAGNLNTELIADYLNKVSNSNYEILPLLEIIDEFLNSLMLKNPWGFSLAQYLSASFNCHPNYATYLINKNTKHIVGVRNILDKLPIEKRNSFDEKYIEKLYINSLLEEKVSINETLKFPKESKILLVASGKSIDEYMELISKKINDNNYIVIALNHKPPFECDYYFFSNQKRYNEFNTLLSGKNVVVSSNILISSEVYGVVDIKKLAFINEMFISNVAITMINYLICQDIKQVDIVGLDGYSLNNYNYNYNELNIVTDKNALQEENILLAKALNILNKKIDIEFLTPNIFKKDLGLKILGVIPARYKSSRFEGKPLYIIKDIPMIKRTYNQAKKSTLLNKLIVATDSNKIQDYCIRENIPVIMTSEDCLTGTDRIAEVSKSEVYDLYVNIQGDEPVIDPKSIDEIVEEFKEYGEKYIAYNLYKQIDNLDEVDSDTIIKVIVNENNELMYMSRLGIPFNKSSNLPTFKKQVCVYGFTKKALDVFSTRDKTLNEEFEDIEILRFLDMGYDVKMKETKVDSIAVDVLEDVQKVEFFLNENGLD